MERKKTSKILSGNGFWESSRMMLPEHKIGINAQNHELKKRDRPHIDFDGAEEIAAAVAKSYLDQEEITVRLFDPFNEREEQGIVERFDQIGRRIKIDGEWIKFDDIIGLK